MAAPHTEPEPSVSMSAKESVILSLRLSRLPTTYSNMRSVIEIGASAAKNNETTTTATFQRSAAQRSAEQTKPDSDDDDDDSTYGKRAMWGMRAHPSPSPRPSERSEKDKEKKSTGFFLLPWASRETQY